MNFVFIANVLARVYFKDYSTPLSQLLKYRPQTPPQDCCPLPRLSVDYLQAPKPQSPHTPCPSPTPFFQHLYLAVAHWERCMSDSPDYIKDLFHLSTTKDNKADDDQLDANANGSQKLVRSKRSCSVDSFYRKNSKKFENENSTVVDNINPSDTQPITDTTTNATTTIYKNVTYNTDQSRQIPKTNKRRLSTPAALPSTKIATTAFYTSVTTKQLASSKKTNRRHNVQSNSLFLN